MKLDFEQCVSQNKIVRVKPDMEIALLELQEGKNDLASAENDFTSKSWKWATDKAYYAMFHAARGLAYGKGYKERSHACLLIAIKELFVKEGLLPQQYLEFLSSGKARREDAIYESKYSMEIAKAHIDAAGEFIRKSEELIASPLFLKKSR